MKRAFIGILIAVLFSLSLGSAEAREYNFDFFTLFENHGAVMLLIEAESGAIAWANEAAGVFYGYPQDVLKSMTIQQINMLSPEDVERERRAAEAEMRDYFIFPHRLADGTIRTVEVYSYPFLMGEVPMLYYIVHDVTERETEMLKLQRRMESFARAEKVTGQGYWQLYLSTGMVTASEGAATTYGLTGDAWRIAEIEAIALPEYRAMLDDAMAGLIYRSEPYNVRYRVRRPADGQIVHVQSVAEYDAGGDIVFGVIHDITKDAEKAALISRQRNTITYSLLGFILILLAFVWLLGLNIRRRSKAESSLKYRLHLEQLVAEVSTSFVSSSADNLQGKLEEMLALVGQRLNVDRCSLLEFSPDGANMTITREWCRKGVAPRKQHYVNLPLLNYPWLARQILSGAYLCIPDTEKLPEDAAIEKEHFHMLGIRTLLTIPIMIFDRPLGHLWLDHVRENKHWSDEEIAFLVILANILSDAMEKYMMENRLISEKERLKITLSSVGDGVIATDRYGRVESINQVAQKLTGWTEEEAVGRDFQDVFTIVNEYTREPLQNPVEKVLNTGQIIGLANHTILIARDGREIAIADSAAPIRDNLGNTHGVVMVFRDVTEEQTNIRKIEYLSLYDQLTGLYNRRFFEAELKRLDNPRNLPISIVMADLNGLKLTNDAFGHEAGDTVLIKAAAVIKSQCRSDDIIARIGGDEFVILLPKTGHDETEHIVKRIRNELKEANVGTIMLSISMGWAQKDTPEMAIADVLRQAESNMYRRKLFESPSMRLSTVNAIIRTLHEQNNREEQHSRRVSELNVEIGQALGLKNETIVGLRHIGMLHDIGKIAVPEAILNKYENLTPEELKQFRRHPEIGYHILSSVNDMAEMAEYVLAHHERWDGQGYPRRLRQKDIPLQARITAVADAYDMMLTQIPYRKALSKAEALEELMRNAGTQFDPEIVDIFIKVVAPRDADNFGA